MINMTAIYLQLALSHAKNEKYDLVVYRLTRALAEANRLHDRQVQGVVLRLLNIARKRARHA